MAIGNDVVIAGEGPDLDGLALIDGWFLNECEDLLVSTEHLVDVIPRSYLLLSMISGLIAVKARSLRSGWVRFYWFLPGEAQEVAWAGNPNKPAIENSGVVVLSPRRSFERWVETRTGYSRQWSNEEVLTASKFRTSLMRWL